jgi:transcriptional regulator with XRE-family HTH domain
VYSGVVLNIVNLDDPQNPILRPNVVIECKETEDWFRRVRILKGPLSKPMTAEEWMSRWIEGLWEGLGEALGVSREEVGELLRGERKGLRVSEVKLLNLYKETFKPDIFIVVSEPKLDHSVKRELEGQDIMVFDEVKIGDRGKLREIALTLEGIAGKQGASPLASLRSKIVEALGSSVTMEELMEALVELGEHRLEELLEILRSRRSRGDGMIVTS